MTFQPLPHIEAPIHAACGMALKLFVISYQYVASYIENNT